MTQDLQFLIGAADVGERLDKFLASRLGWLSRMRINSLLVQGACMVNSAVAAPGYHLQAGDLVEISLDETEPTSMTPEAIPLDIVYEDADLLVVNKPAGMLVHPTKGEKSGTLANALAYHLNRNSAAQLVRPGLVHRLDRATSGLMVIAKAPRAHAILTSHFHRRLVEKRYLALVEGVIKEDEMTIRAPIGRDAASHPKWNVSESGKPAETKLSVLERGACTTLVELEPVTGRTNQLRIHCAHVGHAILGDDWYGTRPAPRLCLHAARLCFHHPRGGDWLEFSSQFPEEILKASA